MKSYFTDMCRAVAGYLCRRPQRKQQVDDFDIPDFLRPERDRSLEPCQERGLTQADDAGNLGTADGRMCFVRDGVRVVFLGTRK